MVDVAQHREGVKRSVSFYYSPLRGRTFNPLLLWYVIYSPLKGGWGWSHLKCIIKHPLPP